MTVRIMMIVHMIMTMPITMIMINGIRIVILGLNIIIPHGDRIGDGIIAIIRLIGICGGHLPVIHTMHTIRIIRITGVGILIPITDIIQDHIGTTIRVVLM
jgi:hypothetical protein